MHGLHVSLLNGGKTLSRELFDRNPPVREEEAEVGGAS